MKLPKQVKLFLTPLLLVFTFTAGAGMGHLSNTFLHNEDKKFEKYTQQIFLDEISSNTLNLHYTLAHPEDYGITEPILSLGEIQLDNDGAYSLLENYEQNLRNFDYNELSEQNQVTLDTLLLYFRTCREGSKYELLEEVLGPTLGIQAQLPVLLAEYTFYDTQDLEDYLALLSQIDLYYENILEFEQAKSEAGYFMNDTSLDGILEQCGDFIKNPDDNYLLGIFEDKLEKLNGLSQDEKSRYIAQHKEIITEHVVPAYQNLMKGLETLRGSCKNENGLCYFPDGREYYQYLLKSQVGVYESPDVIRQQLYTQLLKDYEELGALVSRSPSLVASAYNNNYTIESPESALKELHTISQKDFPTLQTDDYEVKYVHESMEDYLSPAFYLTPPIDTLSPNTIYINQASQKNDLELFTTLAHEGFPGHLYQTMYFGESSPADIRYLPNFGGYVEGWATYIESYAYSYAQTDADLTRLLWLNRSINLCLYSMVDLGVHYYGWTPDNVAHYLSNFGITDTHIIEEIFQAILESPVNYLKYYLGSLNFQSLKTEMQSLQGQDFNLKSFHQQLLEIGPAQFPVIRKHLGLNLK